MRQRTLALALCCLACFVQVSAMAQGAPLDFVRCATVDNAPANILRAPKDGYRVKALTIDIPVAFHIIMSRSGAGNVTNSQIKAQMDVLNDAYAPSGISFHLANIDRTKSNLLFTTTGGIKERVMKRILAIDPAHTLNIYTCAPSGGILGWAYLPWSFNESHFMHGVVMLYSSLPGGDAYPYNEGDTATHEVGHYLGLLHTFENSCIPPGDYIDDTPYEAIPAFGCPGGRDTCPADPGVDPIYNYMDYSDDACMYEFTADQNARMHWIINTYKPGLLPDSTQRAPGKSRVARDGKMATVWAQVKK